jgi:outer membrane protein OmpA-like peptidoglycan-associated protein
MQTKPLKISIPNPCSQNFAEMPKQGDGMYCGQCTKIVYDFSMMTDYELLNFFKTKPDVHCGKFHNSQLNRNIEPVVIRNKFLHKISAIAASVLALVALKPNTAKAQGEIIHFPTQTDKTTKKSTTTIKDSINIKGVVKNEKNEALQNVLIKMDGVGETKTDENGVYDFGIIKVENAHNIYYSCPNYVPVVRSYNAVMGSTVMDIVMGHRDSNAVVYNDIIMGDIASFYDSKSVPTSTMFSKGKLIVTNDCKAILSSIAYKLKENPYATITINAYFKKKDNQKMQAKRVNEIVKYLVEKEGIAQDRISTNLEVDEIKSEVIEFISQ